jgi:hypothetical protein
VFALNGHQQAIELQVVEQLPNTNRIIVDFFHIHTNSPAEYGGKDDRQINIALKWIAIDTEYTETCLFEPANFSLSKFTSYQARQIRRQFNHETLEKNKVNADQSPYALTRGIQFFLYGYGGNKHDRRPLLQRIWERSGGAPDDSVLVSKSQLTRSLIDRVCPDFSKFLMAERNMQGVETITIHPELENALYDPDFSEVWRNHIPSVFERRIWPAEKIFKCKNADLMVNYRQYMIFDYDSLEFFPGCNPAGLSKLSIPPNVNETTRPTVLLQDQFDCANIAHFLFDSCLRAFHWCTSQPQTRNSALFVLGGAPTVFHAIVLRGLADIFGLTDDQFLFPRHTVRLRSTDALYWFSDQVVECHPAQLCRPESVEALQQIATRVLANIANAEALPKKIYISRSDAHLRRLCNEDEVVDFLSSMGFVKIIMSEHTWAEQVAFIAGASTVVAPHGMALTLLAFNLGRPRVVEIFNPLVGSEAYALLSRAYGNEYLRVIGEEIDPQKRDFVVNLNRLKDIFS